jgi:ppGpp synthetase/RelA/SpoT-type nucleotidyltranferase
LVDWTRAHVIVNNWRAAHAYPLNAAAMTLRLSARRVYPSALVSRRIKRLPSILVKLERFPELSLTRIQDIGGCRALVRDAGQVRRLTRLYTEGHLAEHIGRVDDYVKTPREDSGYRSVHLIYRYERKQPQWEGLKVELQLRSSRMHAWATAVEIVDTFTQQTLKTGGGREEWRRFFKLMSSAIAATERTPPVADTPTAPAALRAELRDHAQRLNVRAVLTKYRESINIAQTAPKGAYWFVMVLDSEKREAEAFAYSKGNLDAAQAFYEEIESAGRPEINAVLASVDQAKNLRRAYPNYFLDSDRFLRLLEQAVA